MQTKCLHVNCQQRDTQQNTSQFSPNKVFTNLYLASIYDICTVLLRTPGVIHNFVHIASP